jgi:hypothetical protein
MERTKIMRGKSKEVQDWTVEKQRVRLVRRRRLPYQPVAVWFDSKNLASPSQPIAGSAF